MGESRSLGSLIVRLAAEGLGTYKADMNAAADATGKAGRAIEGANTATKALVDAAKMLGSAWLTMKALDMAKDAAMTSARFETMGVVMRVAGNNAGYTMAQMQGFSKELQASGISMLQSRDSLTQLATANIDLSKASKLARAAQDLAVVGNVNSSEALGRLIDGIKSGEVEVLRSLGLNVSFEASYKKLAAQLGTTSDKLTEQQKTLARTNVTLEGATQYTAIYEESMSTASKQMKSMERYTQDLGVMVGSVFNEALTVGVIGLANAFKDGNKEMTSLAENDKLKAWGNDVADVFAFTADAAISAISVFQIAGKQLGYIAARTALFMSSNPQTKEELNAYLAAKKTMDESYDADMASLRGQTSTMRDALAQRRKVLADDRAQRSEIDAKEQARIASGQSSRDAAAADAARAKSAEESAKATKLQAHEYQKLMESIRERTALEVLELEQSDKLNDADKLKIDLYTKIDAGLLKLTTTQRLALDAALDVYDTEIKAVDLKKRLEKGNLDAGEAHAKYITSLSDGLENMKADSLAQKEANERLGLNKVAIAELDAAKLESQAVTLDLLAIKMLDKNLDEAQYNLYKAQSAELRSLADLKVRGSVNEAGIEAAKATEEANRKAASESEKYWEDALMRAFESGKGFFESLWDTIKNTLKTQVLKVLVTGTLSGLGLTGAASAAGSASGGMIGSAAGSFAASTGLSSFGGAFSAGIGGGMEAFGAGLEMMSGAQGLSSAMAGLGQSMGAALPYVGAVIAGFTVLKNLGVFGSNFVSAADSGRARVDYSAAGIGGAAYSTTGDTGQIGTATTNVGALAKSYFDTAKALGITARGASFEYGTNTGQEGANPMTVLGVNAGSGSYSSGEIASSNSAALQLAASRAVLTALQASEIPNYLKHVFSGITAGTATQDQISNALAYAGSLKAIRTAMAETRTPMQVLKDTVTTGFAELGTSADTFKTDFVAAIDAGIGADKLAQWQALGSALDNLGTSASQQASAIEAAADNIRKLVSGISTSVSDSIFGMQYGLEDNKGKYDMLDVRGARIDGQMRASTDIADIAKLAADQIALLNQSWALMGVDQQKVKLVEFEDRLTAIDDFVKEKGADPVALARAQAKEAADLMAATLKTVLLEALAAPAAAIDSAAANIQAAADTPATAAITVTLRSIPGVEAAIS